MELGGRGVLLIYYLGHGGTDPYRGHVLGTSGGMLWRSDLIEAARNTKARLVVLLTDACSTGTLSQTTAAGSSASDLGVPHAAAQADPDAARLLKSLFLDHEGVVDVNGSTWHAETASGEFGWNNEVDGAPFTSALTRTVMEGRFEQLDTNRDGIVAWSELQGPVTALSQSLYEKYKADFVGGRWPITSIDLQHLQGQATQTPQFLATVGSPSAFHRDEPAQPVPAELADGFSPDRLAKLFGAAHAARPPGIGRCEPSAFGGFEDADDRAQLRGGLPAGHGRLESPPAPVPNRLKGKEAAPPAPFSLAEAYLRATEEARQKREGARHTPPKEGVEAGHGGLEHPAFTPPPNGAFSLSVAFRTATPAAPPRLVPAHYSMEAGALISSEYGKVVIFIETVSYAASLASNWFGNDPDYSVLVGRVPTAIEQTSIVTHLTRRLYRR